MLRRERDLCLDGGPDALTWLGSWEVRMIKEKSRMMPSNGPAQEIAMCSAPKPIHSQVLRHRESLVPVVFPDEPNVQ